MKPTLLTLFSFLLFTISTAEHVFDTDGNVLSDAGRYYILPALWGAAGGGIHPGVTGNQICPVTVLQDYSEVANGNLVRFSHTGPSISLISTGSPLEIAFAKNPDCVKSSTWVVIGGDGFPREWVAVGGTGAGGAAENRPGKGVVTGTFKIEKYDFAYKLVFCPIGTVPPGLCFDIGRFDDKKGRRLVLTEEGDTPFQVVFVKVTDDDDANIGIKSVV